MINQQKIINVCFNLQIVKIVRFISTFNWNMIFVSVWLVSHCALKGWLVAIFAVHCTSTFGFLFNFAAKFSHQNSNQSFT